MGRRDRRSTPEQAKPPASPPAQVSGPVLNEGGGGGGGGGGEGGGGSLVKSPLLLPPQAANTDARPINPAKYKILRMPESYPVALGVAPDQFTVTMPL